ncbi:MAG: hypothetical protein LBN39_06715 [Planctomycetaceae bacterium]|jgi:hypothetical protein|nr:hypothetical protein [Planctomycetaceae bacterium]
MDKKYESPFIHFVRAGILLTALIAVPGAALCWNIVPQDWLRYKDDVVPPLSACVFEDTEEEAPKLSIAMDNGEWGIEKNEAVTVHSSVPSPVPAELAPKTTSQFVSPQYVPLPSFAEREETLKQLGAKYYRLEKWGSKGGLYRFSCYVSPPGPERYQKYFQAIDTDELRVVETVIGEIAQWRNGRK